MEILPDSADLEFGATIPPEVLAKEAHKSAYRLRESEEALGKQPEWIFKCDSIVVPLQDKAPVRFIVVNFRIGIDKYPDFSVDTAIDLHPY